MKAATMVTLYVAGIASLVYAGYLLLMFLPLPIIVYGGIAAACFSVVAIIDHQKGGKV